MRLRSVLHPLIWIIGSGSSDLAIERPKPPGAVEPAVLPVSLFAIRVRRSLKAGQRSPVDGGGRESRRLKRAVHQHAFLRVGKLGASGRERKLTKEFLRLLSDSLFREHFCQLQRTNEMGRVERPLSFARCQAAGRV
jgi:hypothetical protein